MEAIQVGEVFQIKCIRSKSIHEAKVYMLLYLIHIHRVFKPNTLCICIKYTVYIHKIQRI